MNKILILSLVLATILLFPQAAATTQTYSHGQTFNTGGVFAGAIGVVITPSVNMTLNNFTKDSGSAAGSGWLLLSNATLSTLASGTYTGNIAVIEYNLTAGTSYIIGTNSNTVAFTEVNPATMPVGNTNITINTGYFATGNRPNNRLFVVQSITYTIPTPPPTPSTSQFTINATNQEGTPISFNATLFTETTANSYRVQNVTGNLELNGTTDASGFNRHIINNNCSVVNETLRCQNNTLGASINVSTNALLTNASSWSFSTWLNPTSINANTTPKTALVLHRGSGYGAAIELRYRSTNQLELAWRNETDQTRTQVIATHNPATWKHYAVTYDGSNLRVYVDGASPPDYTITTGFFGFGTQMPQYGAMGTGQTYDGYIASTQFYDYELKDSGVASVYAANRSTYRSNTPSSRTVAAHNFTVLTNNGLNIYYNISNPEYFTSAAGTHNTTTNLTVNLTQSVAYINATTLYYGEPVPEPYTITIQNQTGTSTTQFNLTAGTHEATFTKTGWATTTTNLTIPAATSAAYTIENATNYWVNVTLLNNLTLNPVGEFTAILTAPGITRTATTTNASALIEWFPYNQSNASASSPLYDATTTLFNATAPGITNVSILAFTKNSIFITIKNENTQAIITENVTVTISGTSGDLTNTTTNGSLFFAPLLDGIYNVKLFSQNFSNRTYFVTVVNNAAQTLEAYLTSDSLTTLFTVQDRATSAPLSGAVTTMARSINEEWVTIQSSEAGIDGRSVFTYTPGIRYRFTTTKEGYTDTVFFLDPILFPTYTISLSPRTTVTQTLPYQDVHISWNPKTFTNEISNNFTITAASGNGSISLFSFTLSYPGGTYTQTSNNSYGATYSTTFTPNADNVAETVNLTVTYNSTLSGHKTFFYQYPINGAVGNNTWTRLETTDYGLGLFEKIIIATIASLFIWGVTTLYAGTQAGALLGMLTMGYFAYLGFVPLLAMLTAGIVGLAILTYRGSQ